MNEELRVGDIIRVKPDGEYTPIFRTVLSRTDLFRITKIIRNESYSTEVDVVELETLAGERAYWTRVGRSVPLFAKEYTVDRFLAEVRKQRG